MEKETLGQLLETENEQLEILGRTSVMEISDSSALNIIVSSSNENMLM